MCMHEGGGLLHYINYVFVCIICSWTVEYFCKTSPENMTFLCSFTFFLFKISANSSSKRLPLFWTVIIINKDKHVSTIFIMITLYKYIYVVLIGYINTIRDLLLQPKMYGLQSYLVQINSRLGI